VSGINYIFFSGKMLLGHLASSDQQSKINAVQNKFSPQMPVTNKQNLLLY
jgi:hypothetical protein